ncbi:MAG: ribonuclease VapC [Candidatus Altiarchaeota archaeon]|nr:ribonuclease VapC [Candidatus Altiarchaeota archaeon]
MKTVLLDTNFLLLPGMDGIDIFSELEKLVGEQIELATLSSVVSELRKIGQSRSKRGTAANVALALIGKKNVKSIETALPADESILRHALDHENVIVCTNDRELKQKLKRGNVRVITPKGKNYLAFV